MDQNALGNCKNWIMYLVILNKNKRVLSIPYLQIGTCWGLDNFFSSTFNEISVTVTNNKY